MEHPQTFSPGLLYSVAPEDFSELHLQDENNIDEFEWEEQTSTIKQLAQAVLTLFKKSVTK